MEEQDAKTNTYTPEGRILQVEYAMKGVQNGGTTIGITCNDGVVLFGMKKEKSLIKYEKLYKISDGIYCCICGNSSDALQMIGYARLKAAEFEEEFGVPIPLLTLCKKVGAIKQNFTLGGGLRPFGVSILFAGISNGNVELISTDPSGNYNKWRAISYGENSVEINNKFKEELLNEYSLDEASNKLFEMLNNVRELKEDDVEKMEMLLFTKNEMKLLEKDEIKKYLTIKT
ncbi:26S proteasome alpha-type subunit PRE9 [Spraguea lophii 42_110]|uniref:26S proteasome alpha-type subunit PRE9 n=1 Tax=Spraguea lophii (strain 42_110) TaxID=1358809 RepID=S7W5X9_SPRLO|nr:26S proteasome alpha-type subunit PRE9 [Spraguea lophii 42_110]